MDGKYFIIKYMNQGFNEERDLNANVKKRNAKAMGGKRSADAEYYKKSRLERSVCPG